MYNLVCNFLNFILFSQSYLIVLTYHTMKTSSIIIWYIITFNNNFINISLIHKMVKNHHCVLACSVLYNVKNNGIIIKHGGQLTYVCLNILRSKIIVYIFFINLTVLFIVRNVYSNIFK